MLNRPVPREIGNLIKNIGLLIQHPEYQLKSDKALISFATLSRTSTFNKETHSVAAWIALAGRQDILNWIYMNPEHLYDAPSALEKAVLCTQRFKTIALFVDNMKFKYEDIIRRALFTAIQSGNDVAANAILTHMNTDSMKKECIDSPESALTAAAHLGRINIVKTLCKLLVSSYIDDRKQQGEYLRHANFLIFKIGVGYSSTQKTNAAKALLAVINGTATIDSLTPHMGPLSTERLKAVYDTVKKFYFTACQPEAEKTACATKSF